MGQSTKSVVSGANVRLQCSCAWPDKHNQEPDKEIVEWCHIHKVCAAEE